MITLEDLVVAVVKHDEHADINKIRAAYTFAEEAHAGQLRKSGEPYVTHPLEAAMLLTELRVDQNTLIAALLHDVPEDTSKTLEDIKALFGDDVGNLVAGVTKLAKVKYQLNMEQYQVDCLRKMLLMLSEDLRVILIKLADRLHNMRTLMAVRPEKRVRIAKETLEIYAPLAERLGIWSFKWELEDLCFRYLFPLQYQKLTEELTSGQSQRDALILHIKKFLTVEIEKRLPGAKFQIEGRAKHLFSVFRKMERKQKTLSEIYDMFAMRLIVDKISDCYAVLGVVHELWKPKADRFKDYIAAPKVNGYQSLHTTVFCFEGTLVEFQIRTQQMHDQAEHGYASHWLYKDKGVTRNMDSQNMDWLERLRELQESIKDNNEFIEGVKIDLFHQRIFVFTPEGEVKDLPEGSNAIDFAFAVHSNVGYRCHGAKVNGKIVRLEVPLKTGDVVEVLTSKTVTGPKRDWLRIVATARAKSRIKSWFRKQDRDANLNSGRDLLERELVFFGKGHITDLSEEKKAAVMEMYPSYKSFEDVLVAVGEGELSQRAILKRLFSDAELLQGQEIIPRGGAAPLDQQQVYIQGEKDVMVLFAKCCVPKNPDVIVGYITRGRGVTIHKLDCRCVKSLSSDRLVHASWLKPGTITRYEIVLMVEFMDRVGLLRDILMELAKYNINLVTIKVLPPNAQGLITDELVLEVTSVDQITSLIDTLLLIHGIVKAYQVLPAKR